MLVTFHFSTKYPLTFCNKIKLENNDILFLVENGVIDSKHYKYTLNDRNFTCKECLEIFDNDSNNKI